VKIKKEKPNGFALPLVVILGFILAIGGMTLIARSFGGLVGSVRQQKSREAREAAEIGLAVTMEALNGGYGYLMINCYPNPGNPSSESTKALFSSETVPIKNSCFHTGGWGVSNQDSGDREDLPPEFPSSLCPGSRTGYPKLSGSLTIPTMRYRVDYYSFNGTEFYGGSGTIKVTGESLSDDKTKVLATSTIQQTFNVITEPCGGFPGLLMIHDGEIGNNDIVGFKSEGNVHCIGCDIEGEPNEYGMYTDSQLREAVGASQNTNNSQITGDISIGPIDFPEVPSFPETLINCIKSTCVTLNEGIDQSPEPETATSYNLRRKKAGNNNLSIKALDITGNPSESWWSEEKKGKFDFIPGFIDLNPPGNETPPILPPDDNASPEEPGFYVTSEGWRIVAGDTEGALNLQKNNGDYISNNSHNEPVDFCVVLPSGGEMVTHCKIKNINVGNNKLTINTDNGPVRLYFEGETINASGSGGIEHITNSTANKPPASRLGFFGIKDGGDIQTTSGEKTCDAQNKLNLQKITLSGGGGFSDLFAYFPCGITGINGGSTGAIVDGSCTEPGDLNGTVWTAYWDGSNSNVAELCVPDDMINQLRYFFGADFALSVRRYRAQGISDWRGFQGLSQ